MNTRIRRWLYAAALSMTALPAVAGAAAVPDFAELEAPSPVSDYQLAAPLGSEPQYVPGIGEAVRLPDGLIEVESPNGQSFTTHGRDFLEAEPTLLGSSQSANSSTASSNDPIEASAPSDAPRRAPRCAADGTKRFQILYAYPRGTVSRRDTAMEPIRIAVAQANYRLHEDGAQFSDSSISVDLPVRCAQNDISASVYQFEAVTTDPMTGDFASIRADAANAGFNDPNTKYVIFFDKAYEACGISDFADDDRKVLTNLNNNVGGSSYSVVYGRGCWNTGFIPLHEIGHSMGAVQKSAPHSDGAYHCTDHLDTICEIPRGPRYCGSIRRFDCGNDDYFDTKPEPGEYLQSHWNLGWTGNQFLRIR